MTITEGGEHTEQWTCSKCGEEREGPVAELVGERYEKTINPSGSRRKETITTVRCPNCGSEDGWKSESMRDLSRALGAWGGGGDR